MPVNRQSPETLEIPTESDMLGLGADLARVLAAGQVLYFSGELGVGKTTLVRGILRGLGFEGRVKSPSFGLIESYPLQDFTIHHLDLYRLADPEEIAFLGLEDLVGEDSVLLVEWPERGTGWLPPPSAEVAIRESGGTRFVELSSGTGLFDALVPLSNNPAG